MAIETKHGQRKGKLSGFRKWMSHIASAQINVFPVPGEEVFRSKGIHLPHLGYEIASNPRQANVMMLAGPVNEPLAKKAAVAFVQMPRPRVLVFVNSGQVPHLPAPDFQIEMKENDFVQLKSKIKDFLKNPYLPEANALEIPFIKDMLEEQENQQQGHEHHHHGHEGGHQHGEEEHEQHGEHGHHQQEHSHQKKEHTGHEEEHRHEEHGAEEGEHQHEQHEHQESHEEHESHEGHGGHEHEHGGHGGHGGGGFMSMVMMTQDMPRSMDGLPMEHNQAWFGPFFPGLTGGLAFQMMLDGDTVMQVQTDKELWQRNWNDFCGTPAKDLPEKLAAMNPLAPHTYRILAETALSKIEGDEKPLSFTQILDLEKERIGSHLNWLATLGKLAGNQWLYSAAVNLLVDFQRKNNRQHIRQFLQKVQSFKYLKKKLMVGTIPDALLHHTSGPVARAANLHKDQRTEEENYRKIDFEILTLEENNAWGRMKLRLLEIGQSLDMIQRIENEKLASTNGHSPTITGGAASFALESPQGVTGISLEIKNGKVEQLQLQPVANINISIATEAVSHMELSDALLTIYSLDINPYEISVK